MKQYNIVRIECDQCGNHYFVQDGMAAPQYTLTVEHDCCMEKDSERNCKIAKVNNEKHFCGFQCVRDYCNKQVVYAEKMAASEVPPRFSGMDDKTFDETYPSLKDDIEGPVIENLVNAMHQAPLEGEVCDKASMEAATVDTTATAAVVPENDEETLNAFCDEDTSNFERNKNVACGSKGAYTYGPAVSS